MAIAGAVVRWLRDNMSIIQSSAEIGSLLIMAIFFCNQAVITHTHTHKTSSFVLDVQSQRRWQRELERRTVVTLSQLSPASTPPTGSQVQEGETAVQTFCRDDGVRTALEQAVNDGRDLCYRIICGLTQFTNKSHLAFAALEAVCFQTREVRTSPPAEGGATRAHCQTVAVWELTPNQYSVVG